MIKIKLFELRDSATFIPIFAFRNAIVHWADMRNLTTEDAKIAEQEEYLLMRAGFGPNSDHIITIGRLECNESKFSECTYDIYGHHNPRTWGVAHKFIMENWSTLKSGDVIDVEFILGETQTKKVSERFG